jgi:hypothetical protein
MSEKAKKRIQELAWDKFPSQELWIDPNNHFWGFDITGDGAVYCVDGVYNDDDEVIADVTIYHTVSPSEFVERAIETKREQGYECFASQLFV